MDDTIHVIKLSLRIIQGLDSLQDNSPNHHMLKDLPFPWLVIVYYAASAVWQSFHVKKQTQARVEYDTLVGRS